MPEKYLIKKYAMKKLLPLFFIFFSLSAIAQDDEKSEKQKGFDPTNLFTGGSITFSLGGYSGGFIAGFVALVQVGESGVAPEPVLLGGRVGRLGRLDRVGAEDRPRLVGQLGGARAHDVGDDLRRDLVVERLADRAAQVAELGDRHLGVRIADRACALREP